MCFLSLSICFLLFFIVVVVVNWNCWQLYISLFYQRAILRALKMLINCRLLESDFLDTTDRLVMLGNHRDALVYGGADPSSGTAALVEMSRVLGEQLKKGVFPEGGRRRCA